MQQIRLTPAYFLPRLPVSAYPPYHREMMTAITNLPDAKFQPWTDDQRLWLIDQKNLHKLVAIRLDYLQLIQMGYCPSDPIVHPALVVSQQLRIKAHSNHFFSILQVVIHGWELIQEAALSANRPFPFEDPRQLFVEIRRDGINGYASKYVFSQGIHQGKGLKEIRQGLKDTNKFYRDRLSPDDVERRLSELKSGDWYDFWLYGIWNHRHSGNQKLRHAWREFLTAFKELSSLICSTKRDQDEGKRVALRAVKWNNGRAVFADTDTPAKFVDYLDSP